MDLSLRHLPDISRASASPAFPDASFQIPTAASTAADCLLMADSPSFFAGVANVTLASPAKPTPQTHAPLTLEDLTPRSKRIRTAPIRSSLKPRPVIPSPLKNAVAHDLSIALYEALSPPRSRDVSFIIPITAASTTNLLADDSLFLQGKEVDATSQPQSSTPKPHNPLTLSQLTPVPAKHLNIEPPSNPISLCGDFQGDLSTANSFICTSGGDTMKISPHRPHIAVTDSANVIVESNTPPPGSTKDREALHVVIQETTSEEGISARGLRETGKKPDLPNGSNTVHLEKPRIKPKRAVISGGVAKRTHKKLPISGFMRNLTKSDKIKNNAVHPGSRKGAVAKVASQNKSSELMEIIPGIHPEDDTDVPQSRGLAALLMSYGAQPVPGPTESNSSAAGQRIPYGPPETQDQDGVLRPASFRNEKSPRSAQASSSQSAIRSDPDEDSTRSKLDETQRNFSHMSTFKDKLQGTRRTPDSISDSNLTCHQVPTPSGVSSIAHPETPDPACSVVPPSPMRPSVKRTTSAAPTQGQQRKRSRGASEDIPPIEAISDVADSKPGVSKLLSSSNPLQPSRVKNAASVFSSSHAGFAPGNSLRGSKARSKYNLKSSKSRSGSRSTKALTPRSHTPSSGDVQRPLQLLSAASSTGSIANQTSITHASSLDSCAVGKSGDHPHAPLRKTQVAPYPGNRPEAHNLLSASEPGPTFRPESSSSSYRPNISLPPAKPTKPIAFHFQSEARIEVRKAEFEERSKSSLRGSSSRNHGALAIPDFKALHAARESELAARREHIVPTIPVDFEFSTTARAQEREKFEEARRAREREVERLAEEKRRLQELEEEKEIRELRKRAVPKANEIPEWYAFAPKRSHKEGKQVKAGPSVSS